VQKGKIVREPASTSGREGEREEKKRFEGGFPHTEKKRQKSEKKIRRSSVQDTFSNQGKKNQKTSGREAEGLGGPVKNPA